MIHNTANTEIRVQLKMQNITFWMLAEKIGVHESTVTRWFRTELTNTQLEQVKSAIEKLSGNSIAIPRGKR